MALKGSEPLPVLLLPTGAVPVEVPMEHDGGEHELRAGCWGLGGFFI